MPTLLPGYSPSFTATIAFPNPFIKERNHVERFFNRIKHLRRVATRFEKLADIYLAMIKLAAVRLWLRAQKRTVNET